MYFLLIIDDVDPAQQEVGILVSAAASKLGGSDDGHPATNNLHGHIGAIAVELEIGLCLLLILKRKKQFGGDIRWRPITYAEKRLDGM